MNDVTGTEKTADTNRIGKAISWLAAKMPWREDPRYGMYKAVKRQNIRNEIAAIRLIGASAKLPEKKSFLSHSTDSLKAFLKEHRFSSGLVTGVVIVGDESALKFGLACAASLTLASATCTLTTAYTRPKMRAQLYQKQKKFVQKADDALPGKDLYQAFARECQNDVLQSLHFVSGHFEQMGERRGLTSKERGFYVSVYDALDKQTEGKKPLNLTGVRPEGQRVSANQDVDMTRLAGLKKELAGLNLAQKAERACALSQTIGWAAPAGAKRACKDFEEASVKALEILGNVMAIEEKGLKAWHSKLSRLYEEGVKIADDVANIHPDVVNRHGQIADMLGVLKLRVQ